MTSRDIFIPMGLMQPSLRVVLLSTSAGINYIKENGRWIIQSAKKDWVS